MRRLKSLRDAELGCWYFYFSCTEAWEYRDIFTRRLGVGVFKLHTMPAEGDRVGPANYKGFWVTFYYWLPWVMKFR